MFFFIKGSKGKYPQQNDQNPMPGRHHVCSSAPAASAEFFRSRSANMLQPRAERLGAVSCPSQRSSVTQSFSGHPPLWQFWVENPKRILCGGHLYTFNYCGESFRKPMFALFQIEKTSNPGLVCLVFDNLQLKL